MRTIYIILGNSGVGKDYLAGRLDEISPRGVHNSKFSQPGKDLFEVIYGLPDGAMNDRVAREQLCPGTKDTYLQRFIYWFHHQEQIFPPRYFLKTAVFRLEELLRGNHTADIVVTDMRTLHELEELVALCSHYADTWIQPIYLTREGYRGETSDEGLPRIKDATEAYAELLPYVLHPVSISNFGDLREQAQQLLNLA